MYAIHKYRALSDKKAKARVRELTQCMSVLGGDNMVPLTVGSMDM